MNNNILQSFVLDSLSKFNEFNVLESMRISNEILKKQYSSTVTAEDKKYEHYHINTEKSIFFNIS